MICTPRSPERDGCPTVDVAAGTSLDHIQTLGALPASSPPQPGLLHGPVERLAAELKGFFFPNSLAFVTFYYPTTTTTEEATRQPAFICLTDRLVPK